MEEMGRMDIEKHLRVNNLVGILLFVEIWASDIITCMSYEMRLHLSYKSRNLERLASVKLTMFLNWGRQIDFFICNYPTIPRRHSRETSLCMFQA
jgi:hypothetical protein